MKNWKTTFVTVSLFLIPCLPALAQLEIHRAVELEIPTEPDQHYQIQTSTEMTSWENHGTEIPGTGETVFRLVSTRGETREFYRVVPSEASSEVTIDIPSYANLCGRWEYRQTSGTEVSQWVVEARGTTTENRQSVYLNQEYSEGDHPNDQHFLSTDMSEGLFQTGGLNDNGKPTEEKWFWHPPLPKLMKTFVPGARYTAQYTQTRPSGDFGPLEITTQIFPDTISVPYGNDIPCYQVTERLTLDGEDLEFNTWYAKHLGVVKRIQEDGTLWELESYQP